MTPNRRLLAIADDLSGAAEVAAALHSRTTRSRVVLVRMSDAVSGGEASSGVASALRPRHPGEATVLDLDSRYRPAAEAAEAVRDALRLSSPDGEADGNDGDTLVLKKIDSLLRGNVAAEIAALAEGGAGVVLAPALPIAGRVVRSGVVHIGGVALHEGDAWRAETLPPPGSVAQALGGLPIALIPLTTVRASPPALRAALRAAVAAGRVAICDAETDADLDAVVAASLAEGPRMRLVGSGGLAVALGRHLTTALPATAAPATAQATAVSTAPAATNAAASAATVPAAPEPTGAPALTVPAATTATTDPAADTAPATPATPADPAATKPTTVPAAPEPTGAPALTVPAATTATNLADNDPITAPGAANAPAITTPAGAAASTAGTAAPSTNAGAAPTTTAAPAADTAIATPADPATTPAGAAVSAAGAAAPSADTGRPVLVVVGTAEPAASEQIRRLVEDGATHHRLPLAMLLSEGPPPRLPPLTVPVTVVSLAASPGDPDATTTHGPAAAAAAAAMGAVPIPSTRPEREAVAPADVPGPPPSPAPGLQPATPPPSGGGTDRTDPSRARAGSPSEVSDGSPSESPAGVPDPTPAEGPANRAGPRPRPVSARRLVLGLARAVQDAVAAHHGAVDLVLTGGETARRVLDALAVTELDPVGQVHHGAVHLSTPDGRSVVTRPGSFGDPDSLRQIVQALRPHSMERKVTS
ncbi:four-carbon acid sugar kinase family protein [Streptomyces antimycoticus]|uniref:four-carbon acid sugar kinase family protein n=1 Tax=Streptomyces antimycoticus TaxID=68175 RepID=UPI002570C38C|nr:four-carbon acid sugar kinase family protein [Streptomyces antimycoticus]WJE02064.1 four-carbon acid sugar kinase family protein [Streptomyces antimycoticus]